VKSALEYRRLADDCRSLAAGMDNEGHRAVLTRMASAWDGMAAEAERLAPPQPTGEPDSA
jgi:hypothetical protein